MTCHSNVFSIELAGKGPGDGSNRPRLWSELARSSNVSDPIEEWRPVVGYEGLYEVSNIGNVRGLDRTIRTRPGRRRPLKGTMLRQRFHCGYFSVGVANDAVRRRRTVHRLVCEAFHGPPGPGQVVRHLNGNSRDNRSENLCWGTLSENSLDSVRHGTHVATRKTHCKWGHEFTPENTHVAADWAKKGRPRRYCRACWDRRKTNAADRCAS